MDRQWDEYSGDAVRPSPASSARILITIFTKTQVISSSTSEKDWIPSHTQSKNGYHLEVGTASR
jgi:hypothetical protein